MEFFIMGTVHPDIVQGNFKGSSLANKDKVGEGYVYHEGVQYVFARKVKTKKALEKAVRRLVNVFAKFPDGSEPNHLIIKEGSWYKVFSSNTCMNVELIERKIQKLAS